jgi:hypothetical protein
MKKSKMVQAMLNWIRTFVFEQLKIPAQPASQQGRHPFLANGSFQLFSAICFYLARKEMHLGRGIQQLPLASEGPFCVDDVSSAGKLDVLHATRRFLSSVWHDSAAIRQHGGSAAPVVGAAVVLRRAESAWLSSAAVRRSGSMAAQHLSWARRFCGHAGPGSKIWFWKKPFSAKNQAIFHASDSARAISMFRVRPFTYAFFRIWAIYAYIPYGFGLYWWLWMTHSSYKKYPKSELK